jgi:cytochrome c oxidase subunit 1
MGLTIFASMMTVWLARPVKVTPALKFSLGSMFGFMMGGVAGLIQANVGLNLVFHNTQWVVALHAHTFLLTGVATMLFSVIYALVPMLTKLEFMSKRLIDAHFWLWIVGSVVMAYAMGMAGSQGMLRRTFYEGGQFQGYALVAIIGGVLVSIGFLAFLINLIGTLGLRNVLALFVPERWLARQQPVPAQA